MLGIDQKVDAINCVNEWVDRLITFDNWIAKDSQIRSTSTRLARQGQLRFVAPK